MTKKTFIILFAIFIFAYILRVLFLGNGALTFGYDQARDAYVSQEILKGDLKVLGPPASTPGLYHGVFYYYFLAPAYLIGHGSPIITAYWVALFNALSVFIVFYLAYLFSKNIKASLLSAFLFAISFEATQYATWLSNPTIGVWTVPLMYLGLWAWISERKVWGPIMAAIGLGLSIQADIFLLFHLVPLVLWLYISRKSIRRQELIRFFIFLLLSVSTMIVSEAKFGFRGIGGVLSLLTSQDAIVASKGLGDFMVLFLNQLGRVYAYSSYPGNLGYGGVFVLGILVFSLYSWKKGSISWQPFIATWLLSHISVVSVGGTSTPFLLVGIGPAVSILIGCSIYGWWKENKRVVAVAVLAILVFGNLSMIFKENPKGSTIFAIQKDMLLSKQIAAIDYTYASADGAQFSVNSLTSPLWINIVWTYLYQWYGLSKYGYIPQWHGRDQVGQLDSLPPTLPDTGIYYLILEPMGGIPIKYLPETIAQEDGVSKLIEEKAFGELIIQKRQRI